MKTPETLLETRRFRVVRHWQSENGVQHPREIVEHPGSVTIVPLFEDKRVCLIRNYRVGVNEWLIELPAGTREAGEAPLETARREVTEETGYQAERVEPLHEFWMSPGILNERMHLFVALGLTEAEQNLDPGERIEPLVVAWDEALAMADDGRIHDAKTLVGLYYCDRLFRSNRLSWDSAPKAR